MPHVGRWLDARHEFEGGIGDAYDADGGAEDLVEGPVVEEEGADEDVDWWMLAEQFLGEGNMGT